MVDLLMVFVTIRRLIDWGSVLVWRLFSFLFVFNR